MLANNPVLQKIHQNQAVTEDELTSLTSTILTQHPGVDANALNAFYGRTPEQLSQTLIQLVGLDAEQVNERFTDFMQTNALTYKQTQFLNQLKSLICRNGRIKMADLYEGQFERLTNGEGLDIFCGDKADQLEALIEPFLLPQ